MRFIERVSQLPKISIKELERSVRNTNEPSNQPYLLLNSPQHTTKDIKITSPFYSRQNHSPRCDCAYHRIKRYQQSLNKLRGKPDKLPHTLTGTLKNCSLQQELLSNEVGKQSSLELADSKYAIKLRQLLKKSVVGKMDKKVVLQQKKSNIQEDNNGGRGNWERINKQIYKSQGSIVFDGLSKVDDNNAKYIQLISQRLKNNKFKEKYLKALGRFIKMKIGIDKMYLWDSKAYIDNSINILLNHFSMQQLLKPQDLNQQDIQKIAYHMGCTREKVTHILESFGTAVDQMEAYMIQLKLKEQARNKEKMEKSGDLTNAESTACVDKAFENEASLKAQADQNNNLQGKSLYDIGGQNSNYTTIKLIGIPSHHGEEGRRGSKGKSMNFRKSIRQQQSHPQVQFMSTNRLIKSQVNLNLQPEDKSQKQTQMQLRNSMKMSQKSKGRTPRSSMHTTTVNGPVNENSVEVPPQSNFFKKNPKAKPRRGMFVQKTQILEINEKYNKIQYQDYLNRDQFISLINEVERGDKTDTERGLAVYNILKLQNFVDDSDKVDELLQTFSNLIDQNCKEHLLKHLISVRDRRYIERLARQLDQVLSDIKKTDTRHLDVQDLFPYKKDPALRLSRKIRITQYRGRKDRSFLGDFIHYQADETIGRHLTEQQNEKKELQQTQLNNIRSEIVQPSLSQSIHYNNNHANHVSIVKPISFGNANQKKILQYMHKNHLTTFKHINRQISDICYSLCKSQDLPRA